MGLSEIGNFLYQFYHLFAGLLTISLVMVFVGLHVLHVVAHQKLEDYINRNRAVKRYDLSLIFGVEPLTKHHDKRIAGYAHRCRELMAMQTGVAVTFTVCFSVLTAVHLHLFE